MQNLGEKEPGFEPEINIEEGEFLVTKNNKSQSESVSERIEGEPEGVESGEEIYEESEEKGGGVKQIVENVREWKKLPRRERKAGQIRIFRGLFESERQAADEIIQKAKDMRVSGVPIEEARKFIAQKIKEKEGEYADMHAVLNSEGPSMSQGEKDLIWGIAKIKKQEGIDALRNYDQISLDPHKPTYRSRPMT